MTRTIIILLLSLAFLLVTAGCTSVLPVQNPENGQPYVTQTPLPSEGTPEVYAPQVQTSSSAVGISAISRMLIWAELVDCDGYHEMDGLTLKYRFYDTMNRPVAFDGTAISMDITIYTPDTDRRNQQISPRLLYRGSTTISRSLPEGDYPLRGIWVPYRELALLDQDRGIGRIQIIATLPNGMVLEAEERYIWPQKRS